MEKRKKILFLGASITQGKISSSYVKILKERLGTKRYKYFNHGIAGYEAYNVLLKLEKAIGLNPDLVVLLVGTNDVMSSLDTNLARITRKLKHIPHEPTLYDYSNDITEIIRKLNQIKNVKIAIASLPVIGENLSSPENQTIAKYNNELKMLAQKEGIAYLPVYEKQKDFLIQKINGEGADCTDTTKRSFRALFQHFILFKSLDSISRDNGFLLLTDGIHQNSIGAGFIADEVENYIKIFFK